MALVYVDVLGTRARIKRGQERLRRGVEALDEVLRQSLLTDGHGRELRGGLVESDAAALQFSRPAPALEFGIALFRRAFDHQLDDGSPMWVRGVIVPSSAKLRTPERFSPFIPDVERFTLSKGLIRAISTEKAGYHGMRLLVAHSLLAGLKERFAIRLGDSSASRFRQLDRVADSRELNDFREVLWMWTDQPFEWDKRRAEMDRRLLRAGRNTEEFVQAAATELVFKRCEQLWAQLRRRRARQ